MSDTVLNKTDDGEVSRHVFGKPKSSLTKGQSRNRTPENEQL
jgi:hypothetical protein